MHKHSTQLKQAAGSTLVQFISVREIQPRQLMPTCRLSTLNPPISRQPSNAACFVMKLVTLSATSRPQRRSLTQIRRTKFATNLWKSSLDLQKVKHMFSRHHKASRLHFLKDHKWHKKHSLCLVRAHHNFMPGLILRRTIMFNRSHYGAPSSKVTGRTLRIGVDLLVHSKMRVI